MSYYKYAHVCKHCGKSHEIFLPLPGYNGKYSYECPEDDELVEFSVPAKKPAMNSVGRLPKGAIKATKLN